MVPNLRFPEFQGEWEKCKLGDICAFLSGGTPKIDIKEYWDGTIPFVSAISMHNTYISDSNLHISEKGLKNGSKLLKKKNLLLLVRGSMLWKSIPVCLNESDVAFNQDVKGIIPNDTTNNKFLLYWLKSKEQRLKYMVTGTGLGAGKLDTNDLLSMSVYAPSMNEQDKIAKLLSLLDERIATQNKIIDKLQSLIKGIAQHCIRELINGWEYVRLGDICKITTGKLDANAQVENGQYPFFTCAERPFNIDSYAFDTEALLISGNGANLGYINYYKGKFNAYQRTYVLDQFSVNIQYVKWALKVLLPQRIAIEKSSSNTPYIVLSTLADLKIPIPNNSKQNHIADLMMLFERKLSTQLALSDLYNKQKQYLLRQMFI